MKRWAIVVLAVVSALLWSTVPSLAWSGSRGGFHGGFRGHDGFRGHHVFVGARVFIGPGVFFGPPVFYPYPVYSPAPVVVEAPPTYVQPVPQQYWYYCQSQQGYYPYIPQCPGGWLQVVPSPGPPTPGQGY